MTSSSKNKKKKLGWPASVLRDVRRVRKLRAEELDVDIEHFPHDGLIIKGLADHNSLYEHGTLITANEAQSLDEQ